MNSPAVGRLTAGLIAQLEAICAARAAALTPVLMGRALKRLDPSTMARRGRPRKERAL